MIAASSRLERSAPRRVVETPGHKFRIGETVVWLAASSLRAPSRGSVTIVLQMPPLGDVLQYRIRGSKEPREFVVLEHELSRSGSPNAGSDAFS